MNEKAKESKNGKIVIPEGFGTFVLFMIGMCIAFAASMCGLAAVMAFADTFTGILAVLTHGLVALCAGAIIFIAIKSSLHFLK